MRSKSFAFLAVTTAALLFGALTDDASSHKLSSLAVRAFDGAVGTAIELVRPSAPEKRAEQQSTTSARPAPASRSGSELQSPLLARANPVETTSFETTLPSGGPATVTERKTEEDEDVASRTSGAASFGIRGVRPAFGGGLSRLSGKPGCLDRSGGYNRDAGGQFQFAARWLDGSGRVGSRPRLRGAGGRFSPDFTKPSKATAPSGSPSGSTSDSAPPEPGTRPETTPPAGSNPSPVVEAEQPASLQPQSWSCAASSVQPGHLRLCRPPTSARAPQALQAIRPKGPSAGCTVRHRPRPRSGRARSGSGQFHRLIWSMTL